MIPTRTITGPGLAELLADEGPSDAVAYASRRHPLARHTHPGLGARGTALERAYADMDHDSEPVLRPRDTTLTDPLPGIAVQELVQLVGLVEALPLQPPAEQARMLDEALRLHRAAGLTLRALRAQAVGS